MFKKFSVELEGQNEFYEQYLKVINPNLTYESIFAIILTELLMVICLSLN